MPIKKSKRKFTRVREHPRHVPVSKKNPDGITIVDEHPRRLPGTYLGTNEIRQIFEEYDRKSILYPSKGKLPEYANADLYDDLIAVWSDYFNKKFNTNPPLDPDVVKALIGSESSFDPKPKTKIAIGLAQITRDTLRILQDESGEAKDFIFTKVLQKDLLDPAISIPLATRWLFRKRQTAEHALGRSPNPEEIVLSYKGLLKSSTKYKNTSLINFRKKYESLKK